MRNSEDVYFPMGMFYLGLRSEFMITSTPMPTLLFWIAEYLLRFGNSASLTHVTSRMKTSQIKS